MRSTANCRPATSASPWAASRPSSPSAIATPRNGHRCAGPCQAGLCRRTGAQAAGAVRRGRLPALRPGQVVPGRAACRWSCRSAARRWPALLAQPALFADERTPLHYDAGCRTLHPQAHGAAGPHRPYIHPAYEDVFYFLWRERRLPVNVDPFESRLDDEMEQARLRRVFGQKLDAPVGYALPLQARETDAPPASLADRPLAPARRPHVPAARRLAHGLPPAAGRAAVGQPGRLSAPDPARSIRPAGAAAVACGMALAFPVGDPRLAEGGMVGRTELPRPGPASDAVLANLRGEGDPRMRARWTRACPAGRNRRTGSRAALCVEVRDPQRANGPKAEHAHGGKSSVLYVFMRRWRGWRTISRFSPPSRRRPRSWTCRSCSKAIRRRATPPQTAAGDAGPGRDRGQHPSRPRLARARRAHEFLYQAAFEAGCRPRSS